VLSEKAGWRKKACRGEAYGREKERENGLGARRGEEGTRGRSVGVNRSGGGGVVGGC